MFVVYLMKLIANLNWGLRVQRIAPFAAIIMTLLSTHAPAATNGTKEELEKIQKQLRATIENEFKQSIPAITTPNEVTELLKQAVSRASQDPIAKDSVQLRNIIQDGFIMLFKGRGESKRQSRDGWSLNGRSDSQNSLNSLFTLIGSTLFDAELRNRLLAEVKDFSYNSPEVKKRQGFPPEWQLMTDKQLASVQDALQNAPLRTAYSKSLVPTGQARVLKELIEEADLPSGEKEYLNQRLLELLERNIYDKSVQKLISGTLAQDYMGRETEVLEILDGTSRVEKGHILMTGRAGVGKTTILGILSDLLVGGFLEFRDGEAPIILELSILDVTNPSDPSAVKQRIKAAKLLAKSLKRHVFLYLDEAHVTTPISRNAVKSFLTELLSESENQVHLIMSTTSDEARDFYLDSAYSRRFVSVNVREFSKAETISRIKAYQVPLWIKEHRRKSVHLEAIDDEAFELAYRNASLEQPHAGNPTGTKELLEGAVVRTLRLAQQSGRKGGIKITLSDVRDYIKALLKTDLVVGDPNFEEVFEQKWRAFEADYPGNAGAKTIIKAELKRAFTNRGEGRLRTLAVFGPPGAGKSRLVEMIAKHFYGDQKAVLTMNGADFKNGGLEINKLIGSPPGTVGHDEQRSLLTKFIADYPKGGLPVVEEADYLHQDILQFWDNVITKREFPDSMGKTWNLDNYMLFFNSNIGQDRLIPSDSANPMSWEQFEIRRKQATERVIVDGIEVERVRPDVLEKVLEQFVETIVVKSSPTGSNEGYAQELNKKKRRYTAVYILPPTRSELLDGAKLKVNEYVENRRQEGSAIFDLAQVNVEELLDLDRYQFEKGYSYVEEQLQNRLFDVLDRYRGLHGQVVKIFLRIDKASRLPTHVVVTTTNGIQEVELPRSIAENVNPWASSSDIKNRISKFPQLMRQNLRGNTRTIQDTHELLQLKLVDWNTPLVLTLVGSTGNGKTEFARSLATALFGDEKALFTISGVDHAWRLSDYFRPPSGVLNSQNQTEMELWYKSRLHSGGGVVLFDELLSFRGLTKSQIGQRIDVINQLYDILDGKFVRFGNKQLSAKPFVWIITGNALQELFENLPDDPGAEKIVLRTLQRVSKEDIERYFVDLGLDPPKVARLGRIFLNGPLPADEAKEVGHLQLRRLVEDFSKSHAKNIKIEISDDVIEAVVNRMKTNRLGMRKVREGFQDLVAKPLSILLSQISASGMPVQVIELSLDPKTQTVHWFVDKVEYQYAGQAIDRSGLENRAWKPKGKITTSESIRTPQPSQLVAPPRNVPSAELIPRLASHELTGHWMVNFLLTAQNHSEAISLFPGQGYLAQVRFKENSVLEDTSLTTLLIRMATLEAGHRAVFIEQGAFSIGAGNPARKSGAVSGPDDAAKVNYCIESIIRNQLLDGVSELSGTQHLEQTRKLLKDLGIRVADYVIHVGIRSQQFKGLFDQLVKNRFLDESEIESYIKKLDPKHFVPPQRLLLEAVGTSVASMLDQGAYKGKSRELLLDLFERMTLELDLESVTPVKVRQELKGIADKLFTRYQRASGPRDSCVRAFKSFREIMEGPK